MKIFLLLIIIFANPTNFVFCEKCYPGLTKNFNEILLKKHNVIRKQHMAPSLSLDDKLIRYSTEWSRNLVLNGYLKPSDGSNYGENLWLTTGPENFDLNEDDPIEQWYDEINEYSFSSPVYSYETKDFTQMVWINTKKIGCGICTHERITVLTCRYQPKGNIDDQFRTNVLAKKTVTGVVPIATPAPAPSKMIVIYQILFLGGIIIFVLLVLVVMRNFLTMHNAMETDNTPISGE